MSSQLFRQFSDARENKSRRQEIDRHDLRKKIEKVICVALSNENRRVNADDLENAFAKGPLLTLVQECGVHASRDGIISVINQLRLGPDISVPYFVDTLTSLTGTAKAVDLVDCKHLAIHSQIELMNLRARVATFEKAISKDMNAIMGKVEAISNRI